MVCNKNINNINYTMIIKKMQLVFAISITDTTACIIDKDYYK